MKLRGRNSFNTRRGWTPWWEIILGDQNASVRLMITIQSSGSQRLFDHPVYHIQAANTKGLEQLMFQLCKMLYFIWFSERTIGWLRSTEKGVFVLHERSGGGGGWEGNFFTNWRSISFSRRNLPKGVAVLRIDTFPGTWYINLYNMPVIDVRIPV